MTKKNVIDSKEKMSFFLGYGFQLYDHFLFSFKYISANRKIKHNYEYGTNVTDFKFSHHTLQFSLGYKF